MHLLDNESSSERLRLSDRLVSTKNVRKVLAEEPSKLPSMDHLDELEAQSIYILREAFARLKKLALLWSLGKDST
jgi:sulfate adenylyltransferase subunit 2